MLAQDIAWERTNPSVDDEERERERGAAEPPAMIPLSHRKLRVIGTWGS